MRVILKQDIAKLGRKNEVKEVSDGFARNGLLAQGKAVLATPQNLAKLKEVNKVSNEQQIKSSTIIDQLSALVVTQPLKIQAKASPTGHLFAGIHEKDIALAVKRQFNLDLNPEAIKIAQPIKKTGQHLLTLTSDVGRDISLTVVVEALT